MKFGIWILFAFLDFLGGSDGKASVYNAGDPGSIYVYIYVHICVYVYIYIFFFLTALGLSCSMQDPVP